MVVSLPKALLSGIVLFVGLFYGTGAYRHESDSINGGQPEEDIEAIVLPALKWDGTCPKIAANCPKSYQGTPPLIMVSLDGFHPDYLKRSFTPTINKIAQCGTKADFMYSVFPSKTFPNHYSQVTGLNPASHGIVDNSMYGPYRKKLFKVGQPESLEPFWWEKEPIWVTAEKQGKKTGCFFWPGSDIAINGTLPTFYKKYNGKISFESRVDQVLAWLDLPVSSRPSFYTLYYNEPDNAAHNYGVNSKQTNQALAKVDKVVERLFSGLQLRNLTGCVNVMITSDHGMSDIDCKRVINVHEYMDVSDMFATMGPFGRLRPRGRHNETFVKNIISNLRCKSNKMRVYAKEQLPVRMHYADSPRIEPVFLDIDSGWTVVTKGVKPGDNICTGGAHGYDNLFPDMRAIFLAHGPSIKKNNSIRPFINTELYEMISELIQVTPNPNNGTKGSLHHVLRSPRTLPPQLDLDSPAVGEVSKDAMEYNFRVKAANCSCSQTHKQVNIEDTNRKNDLHLPFGVPYSAADNSTLRLLYNEDYILAFDLKYRIPMWTAFTITGQKNSSKVEDICWTGDARIHISDTAKCGDYSSASVKNRYIFQRPLYPPGFSNSNTKEQSAYVSNSIPKSMNHTNILEKKMNQIISQWTSKESQLNVMMGPAFDLQATGVRPDARKMKSHVNRGLLAVPTHIFVIATWCSSKVTALKDCDTSKLETQGFLLPNTPYTQNCEPAGSVIAKNVARVVDIEKLTGLSFYTGLPVYDAIRLRTAIPQRSFA